MYARTCGRINPRSDTNLSGGTYIFSDIVSDLDKEMLDITTAVGSAAQQVLEAFAILVALRLWYGYWQGSRARLAIRGDNIAAAAAEEE